MTKKQTTEIMTQLMRYYPASLKGLDKEELVARRDDFYDIFHGYEYETVKAAVLEVVKTKTFYPAISEIMEAVEAEQSKKQPKAPREWKDEDGYLYRMNASGVYECVGRPEK